MLNVLDLFSGIGGFSLGLESTGGYRTVAFCECEPYARAVLARHWPEVPCYDDVRTLTGERLAADGITVDVICGGFPCQDISKAGPGGGLDGARSGLWSDHVRVIDECRPAYVIVENSVDLRPRGLDRVLGQIDALGYDAEWHCIPACAVGAPHRRDRVWIVAYPRGTGMAGPIVRDAPCVVGSWGWNGEADLRAVADSPFCAGDRWPAPLLRRMDAWPAARVDRFERIGNAVVPAIPAMLGRAILEAEAALNAARAAA